jgi:hypothetical protein
MTELGISGATALNDADVRGLIGKASATTMSLSEWYGASAGYQSTEIGFHTSSDSLGKPFWVATSGGHGANNQYMVAAYEGKNLTNTSQSGGMTVEKWDTSSTADGTEVISSDGGFNGAGAAYIPLGMGAGYIVMAVAQNSQPHIRCYRLSDNNLMWRKSLPSVMASQVGNNATGSGNIANVNEGGQYDHIPGAQDDEGCVFSYVETDKKAVLVKLKWSDGSTLWSWKTSGTVGSIDDLCYPMKWAPYDSTKIQVSIAKLTTTAITMYNCLVNKSTGARTDWKTWNMSKQCTGNLSDLSMFAGFRNNLGAWAKWSYHYDGGKTTADSKGQVSLQSSAGSTIESWYGNYGDFEMQVNMWPDESGRFVVHADHMSASELIQTPNVALPSNFSGVGVTTASATPAFDWSKKMVVSDSLSGDGRMWLIANTTNLHGDGFINFAISHGGSQDVLSGRLHHTMFACSFDMDNAPSNGTYNSKLTISSGTNTLRGYLKNASRVSYTSGYNSSYSGGFPSSASDFSSSYTPSISTVTYTAGTGTGANLYNQTQTLLSGW